MKLVSKNSIVTILPKEMKDGQIGIIRSNLYTDEIVQRFGNDLISLGKPFEDVWSDACKSTSSNNLQIEILPPGTMLEI